MSYFSDQEAFNQICRSLSKKQSDFLLLAYEVSKKAHHWQKRKSGEDYFIHPLAVWVALWNRFHDVELCAAGLLHDAVEDCEDLKIGQIYSDFWNNVWYIVDSVTKTEPTFYWADTVYENERDKMLAGGIKNIWCILVKLADREHNLATLKFMPAEKQIKKSFESQGLYLPLMHILWFNEDWLSLKRCKGLFSKYVKENKLQGFKEIKLKLLSVCFNDFNEELFDIVYENSTNVVWEIKDKEAFNELLNKWWFDEDWVHVKSIEWLWKKLFTASFTLTKSAITRLWEKWKIGIALSQIYS